MSVIGFIAAALGLFSQSQDPFEIRGYGLDQPVEVPYADSKLIFDCWQLALNGQHGASKLIGLASSQDRETRRAALLVMHYSGESRYLPTLFKFLGGPDYNLANIAAASIKKSPAASWPILQQLAKEGHPGALVGINLYPNLRKSFLEEMAIHSNPKVRLSAMLSLRGRWLRRGLDDLNPVVFEDVARRINGYGAELEREALEHSNPLVRAIAAKHAQRWTGSNRETWSELGFDPEPEVRRWAMLHLSAIGLQWGYGPHAAKVIEAVRRGIVDGPASVRSNAILAARGWMLDWNRAKATWSQEEMAAAKRVFRLRVFRDALVSAISPKTGGDTKSFQGIQVASAHKALAISGDERAFGIITLALERQLPDSLDRSYVEALGLTGDSRIWNYLVKLMARIATADLGDNSQSREYHMRELFWSACHVLGALRKKGNLSPLTRIVLGARADPRARQALATSLGLVPQPEVIEALLKLSANASEALTTRMSALFGLQRIPDSRIPKALHDLSLNDPNMDMRWSAQNALDEWEKKHKR